MLVACLGDLFELLLQELFHPSFRFHWILPYLAVISFPPSGPYELTIRVLTITPIYRLFTWALQVHLYVLFIGRVDIGSARVISEKQWFQEVKSLIRVNEILAQALDQTMKNINLYTTKSIPLTLGRMAINPQNGCLCSKPLSQERVCQKKARQQSHCSS